MADESKPRIFQGGRDMTISMAIIVALMVVIVLPTGLCTFNPGAPESGPVQEVDAQQFLSMEAQAVDYPLVLPASPAGWVTNSARRAQVDGLPAPVVGWVTADDYYLQLTQTGVPLEEAVRGVDAYPRELVETRQIADTEVGIYRSQDREVRDLWATDNGQTRFLISGVAPEDQFAELMAAALEATPL